MATSQAARGTGHRHTMATLTKDPTEEPAAPERRRASLRPSRARQSTSLSPLIVPPPVPLDPQDDNLRIKRRAPRANAKPAASTRRPDTPAAAADRARPRPSRKIPNSARPEAARPAAPPRPAAPVAAARPDAARPAPPRPAAAVEDREPPPHRAATRAAMLALGASRMPSSRAEAPQPAATEQPTPKATPTTATTTTTRARAPLSPSIHRNGGGALAANGGGAIVDPAPAQATEAPPPRPPTRTDARVPLNARVPHRQATLTVADPPRSRRHLWLRERPFHSAARCWAIGLLSVVAIALLALYLIVPAPQPPCTGTCSPNQALTLVYSIFTALTIAITLYFLTLYTIGARRSRRATRHAAVTDRAPLYVMVTPAHNEAVVIRETVRCMLRLRGRFLMMVVNDGSTDGTGDIARKAGAGDDRLIVVDRAPEVAGQGKGEVLNAAYREVCRMVDTGDPRLAGAGADDVVLCILDADGWLRSDALETVASYFEDPKVAAVQVPVRMYNARRGFLACMQDIEFIGFSVLIQGGRDRLGSALLGGNGQFVRLAALRTLGEKPWTRALTEDLDIGLRLVRAGWVNRVCVETCVAQQAVTRPRALLRQRTRWVQGHYSCWSHLPALWRSPNIRFRTRLDLSLHLLLATTILVVATQATLGVAGFLGVISLGPIPVAQLFGSDTVYRIVVLCAACGPLGMLGLAYQRAAIDYQASLRRRLPWWSIPGVFLLFTFYVYFWGLPSTFRAFARIVLRRDAWAKTARDPLSTDEIDSERRAVAA